MSITVTYFNEEEMDRFNAANDQFCDMVKASVSSYVEEMVERGAEPSLEHYLDANRDHDHEELHNMIESVIVRELAYHKRERVSA